jgi:hypothetical protein
MGWVRAPAAWGDYWNSVAFGHHISIPGSATKVLAMCMHGETDAPSH